MTFYFTAQAWLTSLKETAFASRRNKVITSIATTTILLTCTIAFIKLMGTKEHKAKKNFEAHKRTSYVNKLPKGDNLEAPEPGKVSSVKDFRDKGDSIITVDASLSTLPNSDISCKPDPNHIRIITWNIERGYRTNEVIQELKAWLHTFLDFFVPK